jgi:hypothetical protein
VLKVESIPEVAAVITLPFQLPAEPPAPIVTDKATPPVTAKLAEVL